MGGKHNTSARQLVAAMGTVVLLGTVLVLATAALAGCGSGGSGGTGGGGDAATDFSGTTLDGVEVSLSEYRGKPVVLAFMASW